jgi:glycosyltransferase involved in cell wall biosynthesis
MLCPSADGDAADWYERAGLRSIVWDVPWALPDTDAAVSEFARAGVDEAVAALAAHSFDLVVTNTLVQLHPAIVAARLGVPHIVWAHELLSGDPSLRPRNMTVDAYIAMLGSLTDHMLCCSESVRGELLAAAPAISSSVLFPHTVAQDVAIPRAHCGESPTRLVFVGDLTARKNPCFAVAVLEKLRMHGYDIELDVYGVPRDESRAFAEAVERSGLQDRVALHGMVHDWRARLRGRPIHLVASLSEPFGLTLPECLSEGVPVVASASGGPSELLPAEWLYRVGDLDAAVDAVEAIAADYDFCSKRARKLHDDCAALRADAQKDVVRRALEAALSGYRVKDIPALLFR